MGSQRKPSAVSKPRLRTEQRPQGQVLERRPQVLGLQHADALLEQLDELAISPYRVNDVTQVRGKALLVGQAHDHLRTQRHEDMDTMVGMGADVVDGHEAAHRARDPEAGIEREEVVLIVDEQVRRRVELCVRANEGSHFLHLGQPQAGSPVVVQDSRQILVDVMVGIVILAALAEPIEALAVLRAGATAPVHQHRAQERPFPEQCPLGQVRPVILHPELPE